MTPKEKAEELITIYYNKIQDIGGELGQEIIVSLIAKQCALIAVDDILEVLYSLKFGNALSEELDYWDKVKQEINNL